MKKRFFAGLLACLMVVGLLPLSMLLKPVSAKADTNEYVFNTEKIGSITGEEQTVSDIFTIYPFNNKKESKATLKETKVNGVTWSCFCFGSTSKYDSNGVPTCSYVKIETKNKATLKIVWTNASSSARTIYIKDADGKEVKSSTCSNKNKETILEGELSKGGTYYLSNSADVYIYNMVVTEDSSDTSKKTEYKITVNDSDTKQSPETVNEGETFTLKATDTANFLYWVNSYGRIVSRDAEYSFPVYYSDTYTAVYKSAETTYKFMTDYDQVYKTYATSDLAIPTSPVKYGYEFDYWKIGETKVSTVEQIKSAGSGTDVEIKPVYKEITETVTITIDGVEKTPKKNEIVTAIADETKSENFMYWYVTGDESRILSYNSLYSFFADDKIASISAKYGTGIADKDKKGIVTSITNDVNGNNKTFVFEFTVPDGCTIEFAGIVASSTSTEPTLTDYEYIRGRGSNAQTFRFSWTKIDAGNTTWNVRPILKYSDSQGNVTTIDTSAVQKL